MVVPIVKRPQVRVESRIGLKHWAAGVVTGSSFHGRINFSPFVIDGNAGWPNTT